jgi:hypothetical protein
MEKLEVTEKKRQDVLNQNHDYLQSKLELEVALKEEKRKLKSVLEGKGNAVLRDKISDLEAKLTEV